MGTEKNCRKRSPQKNSQFTEFKPVPPTYHLGTTCSSEMKPDMGMGQGLVGCLFLVRESNHKKTQNESYFDLRMTKKKNRAKQLCLLGRTQNSFYANKGTLVGGISCSGLLALLICLLSFEDGWDSNETNGDSLEPWELATAGADAPLCGLSGLWGTRSVFRGDAWGTMSPCESEAKMVLKSTSIGSPLELCNQHNLIGNNIENDSIHVHWDRWSKWYK